MKRPTIKHHDSTSTNGYQLPHFKVDTGLLQGKAFSYTRGNPVMEERARARAEGYADGWHDAMITIERKEVTTWRIER